MRCTSDDELFMLGPYPELPGGLAAGSKMLLGDDPRVVGPTAFDIGPPPEGASSDRPPMARRL